MHTAFVQARVVVLRIPSNRRSGEAADRRATSAEADAVEPLGGSGSVIFDQLPEYV
jgi:hypothetical protein